MHIHIHIWLQWFCCTGMIIIITIGLHLQGFVWPFYCWLCNWIINRVAFCVWEFWWGSNFVGGLLWNSSPFQKFLNLDSYHFRNKMDLCKRFIMAMLCLKLMAFLIVLLAEAFSPISLRVIRFVLFCLCFDNYIYLWPGS